MAFITTTKGDFARMTEDEKFSIWDYIDKRTLITIMVFIAFIIALIIALYLSGIIEISPDGVEPIEPHLHP